MLREGESNYQPALPTLTIFWRVENSSWKPRNHSLGFTPTPSWKKGIDKLNTISLPRWLFNRNSVQYSSGNDSALWLGSCLRSLAVQLLPWLHIHSLSGCGYMLKASLSCETAALCGSSWERLGENWTVVASFSVVMSESGTASFVKSCYAPKDWRLHKRELRQFSLISGGVSVVAVGWPHAFTLPWYSWLMLNH